MNNNKSYSKPPYSLALKSVCVFAAVHILMCFLSSCYLPSGSPWNIIFLGIEFAFAAIAFLCCVTALVTAFRDPAVGRGGIVQLSSPFRQPGFYLILAWCACSFIACFLAIGQGLGGLYHNGRYLFYLAVSLLVLFPLGFYLGQKDKKLLMHILFDLCLLCFCVFLIYGFYRFFRGDFSFKAFFGRDFRLKKARMRLGQNTNTTGCYSIFFLVMGFYRLGSLKKGWQKALLILAMIPVCAGFAVVESRSAVVSGAVAFGFLAGAAVYRRRKDKGFVTILLSLLVFIVTAGAFIAGFYGLRRALNLMQQKVVKYYTSRIPKKTSNTRPVTIEEAAEMGGRITVWSSVIRHVFKTPSLLLHGCTQSSTSTIVESLTGKGLNTHNQFLEVLLAYGLPSLILFLLWLLWTAGKSMSLGLRDQSPDNRWQLPVVLLLLVVNNMAETMLVARGHFVGGFFFLIAGYVCAMAPQKQKTPSGVPEEQIIKT